MSVYDEREDFAFPVAQFLPNDSNVPRDNILGVFQSQIRPVPDGVLG